MKAGISHGVARLGRGLQVRAAGLEIVEYLWTFKLDRPLGAVGATASPKGRRRSRVKGVAGLD
jgi:hypothetical protein